MKIIKVSYENVKSNLKHNVKIMLVILSICLLIGCIIGGVNAAHYSPVNYDNTQTQGTLTLDDIERDGAHYYNAFMQLKERYAYLSAYLECLERIELSKESKEIVVALRETISAYKNTYNDAINFYCNEAPCIPGKEDSALNFYESKIKELERNTAKQEARLEYEEENRDAIIDYIVKIQERIELFHEHSDLIENRQGDATEAIANEADDILNTNYQELNTVIKSFDDSIAAIERLDRYEIEYCKRFFNDYAMETDLMITGALRKEIVLNDKKGQAIIYAKSIEGVDVKRERFSAIFMFFALFGVVISFLVGAFYCKKGE